jgi:hypothetical protein
VTRMITGMATKITRDWIQYLKNNQIVSLKSAPSGKLSYKRPVTSSDVVHFLQSKTSLSDTAINNAIDSALKGRTSSGNTSPDQVRATKQAAAGKVARDQMDANPAPAKPATAQPTQPQTPDQIRRNKQTIAATNAQQQMKTNPVPQTQPPTPTLPANVQPARTGGKKPGEVSQTPNAIRKRQARANRKAALNEDFSDDAGEELSEQDVEKIFALITSGGATTGTKSNPKEDVDKIKSFIAGGMSSKHRKQLWDMLNGKPITEDSISRNEIKGIFYTASNTSGIDMNTLRTAWKDAGYPDDSTDIIKILRNNGFSDRTIKSILDQELSDVDTDMDNGADSDADDGKDQAVIKLANYIKKNNLSEPIIAYMRDSFGDELVDRVLKKPGMMQKMKNFGNKMLGRKVTHENVRNIFAAALAEQREDLPLLIKQQDILKFGRARK